MTIWASTGRRPPGASMSASLRRIAASSRASRSSALRSSSTCWTERAAIPTRRGRGLAGCCRPAYRTRRAAPDRPWPPVALTPQGDLARPNGPTPTCWTAPYWLSSAQPARANPPSPPPGPPHRSCPWTPCVRWSATASLPVQRVESSHRASAVPAWLGSVHGNGRPPQGDARPPISPATLPAGRRDRWCRTRPGMAGWSCAVGVRGCWRHVGAGSGTGSSRRRRSTGMGSGSGRT